MRRGRALIAITLAAAAAAGAQDEPDPDARAAYVRDHYVKREEHVPMRDGVRLFTAIFTPKQQTRPRPILMRRTPYGVGPYGPDAMPRALGPSEHFERDGYIVVLQDVRGRYMSEGSFVNMRPHVAEKRGSRDMDESTDAYDTIEWLMANVGGHNGRVGTWGISYPGFYTSAGMIDAHPALAAASPQAPIADWFFEDFHHHGVFFLPHCFNFLASFGRPRPEPTTDVFPRFEHPTPDGYAFFLELGPLRNADRRWFRGDVPFWNEIAAHPDYDAFWQERNLLPHLRNVAPAVMTVGGWFDAENLYGALATYRTIEQSDEDAYNVLVMGPWSHGGWSRTEGDRLGVARFGENTSLFYRASIEVPFFEHFLDPDTGAAAAPDPLPEAFVFETGRNRWRTFDAWPPAGTEPFTLYLRAGGSLADEPAPDDVGAPDACDAFVSDPARPVPFTQEITTGMAHAYMTDDQRFAARRPDVLVYATPPLDEPITVAGPLAAELFVTTSATDADWIVKLIDVLPDDAEDPPDAADGFHYGGAQLMVRSEAFRGRFRDDYAAPKPFEPGLPARVRIPLQDVLHTFERGHRIMIHVQSTWFPLVDRNPQRYVPNVFEATEEDFVPATHRVLRDAEHPSRLELRILPAG